MKTTLTDDDYEKIAARLKNKMDDTFWVMQVLQGKLQGAIDQQLVEFKTLAEKTATIHTQLIKMPTGENSTQSISREEILAKDRIRFPTSMMDVQIQIRKPVEVNLAKFHFDQLKMIQQ